MKTCTKCLLNKTSAHFGKSKTDQDVLDGLCKECIKYPSEPKIEVIVDGVTYGVFKGHYDLKISDFIGFNEESYQERKIETYLKDRYGSHLLNVEEVAIELQTDYDQAKRAVIELGNDGIYLTTAQVANLIVYTEKGMNEAS